MTVRDKVETVVARAVKLEQVPSERFSVMLQRTILGLLLVGIGVVGLLAMEMNHYLAVGLVLLGATVWSGQIVTGAIKGLVGPIRALFGATRGE